MSWWPRPRHADLAEKELDAELRDHVERQVADHIRAGMSAREARRRTRLEFGGLDQVKETCRDVRGARWLEETWQDLRFAVRLLVKERGLTAAAVLALGLGIGLTGAAFTVYNAVLVRGLPVDAPEGIMTLGVRDAAGRERGVSYLDFHDWRAAATSFEDIAAYSEPAMNVGDPDLATERYFGARVTANTFRLLGIQPLLGRDFQPQDDRLGAPVVVMLGHGMWANRYGADPEVLGRVILVNDVPATVVGVMPADFAFPQWAELWQPLGVTPGLAGHARDQREFGVVGRLADGMTVSRAQADLDTVAAALAATHPDGDPLPTAGVITIADDYFEALGLRLQRGRPFTDRDGTAGNDSVIVNRRLADMFFPDEDPLGRRMRLTARGETDEEPAWLTIVGVSPTVRQTMSGAPGPVAYLPYRAEPIPFQHLLVRGAGGTDAAGAARETVRQLDPGLPIARVWTLDGVLAQTGFIPQLIGSLLGAFAWVALVLSAVGLYGMTAYAVNQRTQEIGVRMALGAGTGQVSWMVLRRGLVQLGLGLAIGIWGALTVGRLFESWLVDTAPADPVTQASVAVLLGGVAVVACVLPARRAARLDPMVALRHE